MKRTVRSSSCSPNFFSQSELCYLCDQNIDQAAQLSMVLLTSAVVVGVLSLSVTLLSTKVLAWVVIGISAALRPTRTSKRFGRSVNAVFVFFNLINMDIELLRHCFPNRPCCHDAAVGKLAGVMKQWFDFPFRSPHHRLDHHRRRARLRRRRRGLRPDPHCRCLRGRHPRRQILSHRASF